MLLELDWVKCWEIDLVEKERKKLSLTKTKTLSAKLRRILMPGPVVIINEPLCEIKKPLDKISLIMF